MVPPYRPLAADEVFGDPDAIRGVATKDNAYPCLSELTAEQIPVVSTSWPLVHHTLLDPQ